MDKPASPSSFPEDTSARTPPEQAGTLPLTPPPTDNRAIANENALRERSLSPLLESDRPCTLREYRILEQDTKFEEETRYDYDPRTETITLRMPSPVHEFVRAFLEKDIGRALQDIADDPSGDCSRESIFADQVTSGGSARIYLAEITNGDVPLRRQPDVQFQHEEAAYPGLVVEVSYSQDGKDLDKLAWEYIQGSNANIKVVIGIDINVGTGPSTVSLWRPKFLSDDTNTILDVQQDIKNEPFLSSNGEMENKGKQINIMITDFATDSLCQGLKHDPLTIKYQRLAAHVKRAEKIQQGREVAGRGVKSTQVFLKRKRHSSPLDQISEDDEARFQQQERAAIQKADAKDNNYM